MTREELIKKIDAEIAKLSDNASQICEEYEGYRLACQDISDELHEIAKEIQPSLPSNLDGAADDYGHGIFLDGDCTCIGITDAFKAGADWMAGQGATCNGKIQMDFSAPADIYARRLSADYWNELGPALMKVEPGDVLIQIRKKQ